MQKINVRKFGFYAALLGSASLATQCDSASSADTKSNAVEKSFDANYLDTTFSPQEDFYQFANGTWIKNTPVPASESRYGSFNEVKDRNDSIIKNIVLKAAEAENLEKGSSQQLVGDYYKSFTNWEQRNAEGLKAFNDINAEIDALTVDQIPAFVAGLNKKGISTLFGFSIFDDLKNNTMNALYFTQAGLGLPDKDYYFKEDDKSVETREEYRKHINKMFELASLPAAAADVYAFEEALASASMNGVEQRNIGALYNKFSFADFNALCPSIDFGAYITNLGAKLEDTIIVMQPEFYKKLDEMVSGDFEKVKTFIRWDVLNSLSGVMNKEADMQNFAFYSQYLRGKKEQKEDWKRGLDALTGDLGEVLGKAYVEIAFSEEAKAKVNEMVDNLSLALAERLKGLAWMSDETKEKALLKMNSFGRKLAYPDTWKNYSSINIVPTSYTENWMAVNAFNFQEMLDKQGQPVDKTEWGMPAHMVNAYYSPLNNEIAFPAGIMQPPFFDPNAEDAVNYARMGAVIGHEMIHGFDDNGARFDHKGSFNNWWTEADQEKFKESTTALAEQYNAYEVLPEVHVNGELTLGENIADFGGLTVAYYAYMKSLEGKETKAIDGYSPEQRFFISFAQIWKGNATDDFLRTQVATDPHSPTEFRVNGTLSNMPEFFAAFNVEEGDAMRNSEDNLVSIW